MTRHWLVRGLGGGLVALILWVAGMKADSMERTIESVTTAVSSLKNELITIQAEQRLQRESAQNQLAAYATRLDILERRFEASERDAKERRDAWDKQWQLYLDALISPQRQETKRRW